MISYNSMTAALIWIAIFNLVLFVIAWALGRMWSRDVTLEVTPMSHRRTWLPGPRAALLRELSWAAFVAGLDGASLALARRAERIERRARRRARTAERQDARALTWDRTLASSLSSPPSLPPSAPRPAPALDWSEDESARRWERTLPWGTPSPLLQRDGRAKPYQFSPLAPPLSPPAAPSSGRRSRRNP